jgi:hypothetical protein
MHGIRAGEREWAKGKPGKMHERRECLLGASADTPEPNRLRPLHPFSGRPGPIRPFRAAARDWTGSIPDASRGQRPFGFHRAG